MKQCMEYFSYNTYATEDSWASDLFIGVCGLNGISWLDQNINIPLGRNANNC